MCGITGFIGFKKPIIDKNRLWEMTKILDHRGPDDSGIHHTNNVGLGHTRLSIIDLSSSGHQPMISKDGEVVITYNGEVYNYLELKNSLIKKGIEFFTNTDTEVVLKAYIEWGTDIFSKFEGMFAFAIWDNRKKIMYLVRDRFGIKPLYYYNYESGIIFSSEIKSILASKIVQKNMSHPSLHEYMWYGNTTGNNTMYENIFKVPPGNILTVKNNKVKLHEYCSFEKIENNEDDINLATETVLQKLDSAVRKHLISDVPVGVFLSGGIDSSAITAIASKYYNGKLKTFSAGFDFDKGVNELPKARKIANLFNTDHHELNVSGINLSDTIENLVEIHDEPFADAANIPLYLLCQQLGNSIKVVLQGDGGDEIFAGYRRYNILSHKKLWRHISNIGLPLSEWMLNGPSSQRYSRFFFANKQKNFAMQMALLLTQNSPLNNPTDILNKDLQYSVLKYDPFNVYKHWHSVFDHYDYVKQMLFTDCKIQLPNTFLEKVDKPTMANSIEIRVPFLDNTLTDYVLGLPSNYKVRNGNKKRILKLALKNIVPDSILNGKKTGFDVPFAFWLRKPLADYMRSVLLDNSTINSKLFNPSYMVNKIDNHILGKENNGFILWKVLNLSIWYQKYMSNQ